MTPETMKQLFMEFEDALLHPEKLSALITPDYVAHDLPPGMSLPQFRAIANAALPDTEFEVVHLIAEGNLVSAHLRVTGTHQGVFRGIQPTGKKISFEIFEFVRVENGKMAEQWVLVDWLKVYQQLGVTAIPG
jgi:predicted ester cyclase